jgi:hypothetical protein
MHTGLMGVGSDAVDGNVGQTRAITVGVCAAAGDVRRDERTESFTESAESSHD